MPAVCVRLTHHMEQRTLARSKASGVNLHVPNYRTSLFALLLLALPVVAGCDSGAGDLPEGKAERAAAIAKEIQASPDKYEEILSKYDLDADKFEALMFEIAEDPELSNTYNAALGK